MTVEDWIEHCAAALERAGVCFGHGTDNAVDEAAWLVVHCLGEPCDGSFEDWGRAVQPTREKRIKKVLQQRIHGRKPLAYLLGEAWFCGLRFTVHEAVVVPRSPIAELIERRFAPWLIADRLERVLDLGTGSGCIAISVAVHLPRVRVDAVDVSTDALAVAAANVAAHGVGARVQVLRSNGFGALSGRRYDLIVSNPPYVGEGEYAKLPAEYLHEPRNGLVSGADGLTLVLEILRQSPAHLTDSGVLVCEVGRSADALQRLLPSMPLTWVEFAHGGAGVFTISREQLLGSAPAIRAALEPR